MVKTLGMIGRSGFFRMLEMLGRTVWSEFLRIPLRRLGGLFGVSRRGGWRLLGVGMFGALMVGALAFPPAPHHRFFGMVRNEYGHPIIAEGAEVLFETSSGQLIRTLIHSSLPAGENYRLDVPMDAGLTEKRHVPTAMRPEMPFTIRVRVGNQIYLPIEMVAEDASRMGLPGGKTRLNLTLGEDLDGDGLPDAWERSLMQRTGLDDVDPNADSDGDGLTNLQEYISGNYAYDEDHEFALSVVGFNAGAPVLEFRAIRGRSYTVFSSADLKTWIPTPFRITADAGRGREYDRYYAEDVRDVRIEIPPGDGDGALKYFKLKVQ